MESAQNGGTEPAPQQLPASPPSAEARHARVVGMTALALATSLVIQNALLGWVHAPGYGDPLEKVLAFHAQNRTAVAIATGSEALNLPLLLGLVVGLHGLVGRRGGAGADWSRLAVAAGATLSGIFALYAVLWDGVVLTASGLAAPSPEFELAWRLHAGAFAFALPALGTTFIGAAMAANASGLTPKWQRLLGVAGAGLLVAAGMANLAIADGSPLLFIGMPGYAAWIVWLVATGARLARSSKP